MDSSTRRVVTRLVVVVVLLVGATGVGAAQSTQADGNVVVAAGETVGDLQAAGGTVVVRGTVDGDLRGYAGAVVVEESGVVTGDLRASAGTVTVRGTVEGDLEGAAGSVSVTPGGVVGGDVSVAAADLVVAGTVDGSVEAAVERLELASTASVAGAVRYSSDAELVRDEAATVGGQVSAADDLSVDAGFGALAENAGPLGLVFGLYFALATLLLGAVLLVAFPDDTATVVDEVSENTLRSGGIGLLGLIGLPTVLGLVAVTIIGAPVALLGLMAFGILAFVSAALAEYAVGAWALSYTGMENRWVALLVGVAGVGLLSRIPVVGDLINLVVFLLGFGAVLGILYRRFRRHRDRGTGTDTGETDLGVSRATD